MLHHRPPAAPASRNKARFQDVNNQGVRGRGLCLAVFSRSLSSIFKNVWSLPLRPLMIQCDGKTNDPPEGVLCKLDSIKPAARDHVVGA